MKKASKLRAATLVGTALLSACTFNVGQVTGVQGDVKANTNVDTNVNAKVDVGGQPAAVPVGPAPSPEAPKPNGTPPSPQPAEWHFASVGGRVTSAGGHVPFARVELSLAHLEDVNAGKFLKMVPFAAQALGVPPGGPSPSGAWPPGSGLQISVPVSEAGLWSAEIPADTEVSMSIGADGYKWHNEVIKVPRSGGVFNVDLKVM